MTMVRTLITALLIGTAGVASAQKPDYKPVDSPDMIANATKHMQLVDRAVDLNADQEAKVTEVYLQVERQMKAIKYRLQGQPAADAEADLKGQYAVMDELVQRELATILTTSQMNKWMEDSK
ncbi:MAG: hypothetical protein JNL05_14540 [Flavobacteriales bacterium]|nr:hypothetical protein [Flavobacteriales bacterium]